MPQRALSRSPLLPTAVSAHARGTDNKTNRYLIDGKKNSHNVRLKIASPDKFSKYTRRNWSGTYEENT